MTTREKAIQNQVHRALGGRSDIRLFRNNSGVAHHGTVVMESAASITLKNPVRVRYGVPPTGGGSDLIGWVSKTITPDMVGQKVAVFLAVEIKSDAGKPTAAQEVFIEQVNAHGGIAGIVRSVEEAERMVE